MLSDEIAFTSATELRQLIGSKSISPVELVELYLTRIDGLNDRLHAYLTVTPEAALTAAREAEAAVMRGEPLGSLHGLPISVKDLELTKGMRSTAGSLAFANRMPDRDSIVVERVRRAGAIVLGKTNTPEFGLSGTTENRLGEGCRNPWNTERTSGGSSGGAAAAVSAGLCALATGTDGGGSIRIPASFCGVYGIKPTQGRVPRFPAALPLVANQLSQPGPITRTVEDSALLLSVLAGYDPRDPASLRAPPDDYLAATLRDVNGLRIAWSADYGYATVDPQVVSTCSEAARRLQDFGCTVDDARLMLDEPFPAFWTLFATSTFAAFGELLQSHGDRLTDYARATFEYASTVSGVEYARAVGYLDRLRQQFDDLFDRYDLLLSPTMAVAAFPVEMRPDSIAGRPVDPFWGFLPFTYPINMIGHPAASVPCGFSSDGLPIGLHIVGRRGDEATVLAASAAFERACPWRSQRPPVS